MKLEVIKSYTLAILVGISLILSFSLWNFQSKDDPLESDELVPEEQIDLGGTVETRKTLIQPTKIIFDANNDYYGFKNPVDMQTLYEDIQSWVLYNFRSSEANGRPNDREQIEVIYPTDLPMKLITSLFTVNNNDNATINLPENMTFKRMYITFNTDNSLTFNFLSTDGNTQLKADVNNAQKYEMLKNYINSPQNLEEYMVLQEEEYPIYLPESSIETASYRFNVVDGLSQLDPEILKNALFIDPPRVFENVTDDMEVWYQDGHRMMRVFANKINMEYVNPQETLSYNPMTFQEVLDASIAEINDYKGWVENYQLETLNSEQVQYNIRFQMHYRGYPVFNHDGLSVIEQKWVNNELQEHKQPLYTINNEIPESYSLPPGEKVVSQIKNSTTYDIDKIEDIKVGYRLSIKEVSSEAGTITLALTPAWYVKVNGNWDQIIVDDEIERKGVS